MGNSNENNEAVLSENALMEAPGGAELMSAASAPAGANTGEISMGPSAANVKADGAQINANVGASLTLIDLSRGDKGKKQKSVNYSVFEKTLRTLCDTLFVMDKEEANIGEIKKLALNNSEAPQLAIQFDDVVKAAEDINFPLSNDLEVKTLSYVITAISK